MSQAEYSSRPFPLVAKLASLLRNNAAVQFVFARFAGLLRGNKSSDEPLVSPFLGKMPSPDETPGAADPNLDETPSLGEIPALELRDSAGIPSGTSTEPPFGAPQVFVESATAARSDPSEREKLIRRRWTETGIKMWNAEGAGHTALSIQGHADLLPVKPGATRREYDRLEFKLIAGQIVCEGVAFDPPARRK